LRSWSLDSAEMISVMRLTRVAKGLAVFVAATAVVSVVAPNAGLVMAIVLAAVTLFVLAEGVGSSGPQAGHDAWARVETERKREVLRRGR
jgi:glyoxylate carboligase